MMRAWTKETPNIDGYYPVIYRGGLAICELWIGRDDEAEPDYYGVWILSGTSGMRSEASVASIDYWGIRLPPRPR